MASINGSDSSSSSSPSSSYDEVRRNRDDYRQNESDMVKRHQKEIRRLNEAHAQEVDSLKAEHDRQITEMQKHASDNITARDQKHQEDIDNIRALYRKQMQSTAEDTQHRETEMKDSVRREIETEKINNSNRLDQLRAQNSKETANQEERVQTTFQQNREDEVRGLNEQRQKLVKAHQEELTQTREERDQKIAQLQSDYGNYRRDASQRLRGSEVKHLEDSQRQADSMVRAIQNERAERAAQEQKWRTENGEGVQDVREHYKQALEQNTKALEQARGDMESDYHGHVNAELERLRGENETLKGDNERNSLLTAQHTAREINHVKGDYTKNIENYKMQRDEAVRLGNEHRKKDIDDLAARDSKTLSESNRYYLEKMNDQNTRLRQEYQTIDSGLKGRTDEIQQMSDARVQNIMDMTEEEKQRLNQVQAKNHETMQRDQHNTIRTAQITADTEKNQAIERIKERARQLEINQNEKLSQMDTQHRHEVRGLQDQMMRDRKVNDENSRRMIEDMERLHKNELDQQMAKYEERIRALQSQQQEEIRRVNRANEERLSQVAATKSQKA